MNLFKWVVAGALLGALGYALQSEAQTSYNNSPLNWANSSLNFDNSPLNYNNSPLNYNNSPLNWNATNGVFDVNGNRIGYTTVSPQGTVNIYSNQGDRTGYVPPVVVPNFQSIYPR
jgi:hypothetical protein